MMLLGYPGHQFQNNKQLQSIALVTQSSSYAFYCFSPFSQVNKIMKQSQTGFRMFGENLDGLLQKSITVSSTKEKSYG